MLLNPVCTSRIVSGFTLVEVMITLVILAVLSSLAIPWYGDYTRKTRVAESINLASVARNQTVEMIASGDITTHGVPTRTFARMQWGIVQSGSGSLPTFPTYTEPVLAETLVTAPNPYIKRIVRAGSVVIISYTTEFDPNKQESYSLVYYGFFNDSTGGNLRWYCLTGPGADYFLARANAFFSDLGPQLPSRWAPSNCSEDFGY